ncbi:MAG: hypothetical protein J0L55_09530 [Caulobacterales bacterium]|nr:hypothetical protein [Caulobacterales bacterium]MCA0373671.1 hypothetical protein [Pseudomonadota bacterium]
MFYKFNASKNIFIHASIVLSIGLIYPNPSNANPIITNSTPEKLVGAVKIGENYTKMPIPFKPLDKAPPNPPNVIGCTTPSKGFYNTEAKCEYKAKDGINYYLGEDAKIYRIAIYKDANGNWPKPLPFGIKSTSAPNLVKSKFLNNGFSTIMGSTIRYQTEYDDTCFYSKKSSNSVICFFYNNKTQEIDHLKIFKAINFENDKSPNDDFEIGNLFSNISSPIIAIDGSPEMNMPTGCENKDDDGIIVNSLIATRKCEYIGADGLHYYIDYKSRIYRIDMDRGANNKWAKPFPIGVKPNDKMEDVQKKILKSGHLQLKNSPNCYQLKNGKGETACFGFDENKKISSFSISIWRFAPELKN